MANAISYSNVDTSGVKRAHFVIRALLLAFVLICVFDPADQVLGAKVWVFVALCAATLMTSLVQSEGNPLPMGLVFYVLLFVTVPVLSIVWYYLSKGSEPYAGFALLKGFLLLALALVLAINRLDVVPILSGALTVLASLTIAVFVALQLDPDLFNVLRTIGAATGALLLSRRSYGDDLTFTQVYFVASPMLAIAIPYYINRAMSSPRWIKMFGYLALAGIDITGMILVASRNTMAVAVVLPFLLWPIYTRKVAFNLLVSLSVLAIAALPFVSKLQAFLNPEEFSNSIKLTLLGDYAELFGNPMTLLFGQGLGAYHRWTVSGRPEFELTGEYYYFNTELTYLELVRYFGLPGAAILMALLLYPIAHAFFASKNRYNRALSMGFLAYLGMCATNPMLLSSLGFLLLAALVANTFTLPTGIHHSVRGQS